ncbi:MAG TPA: TonB-dependent receptor [Bacteroidales bacterium]|nr:TonB-dependent receptor [Bacteroidales bacterium]
MMKKFFLTLLVVVMSIYVQAQNATLRGSLANAEGKPLVGAKVMVGMQPFLSDAEGRFVVPGINYGTAEISFDMDGYETKTMTVEVNSPEVNLGMVQLKAGGLEKTVISQSEVSASAVESEDDIKEQYIGGLLHSANDIFVSTAGYTLSAGYFRPRGYDNEYSEVSIGGLSMNDPETGRPNYSDWGGLNDATRYKESVYGLSPSRFAFGSLAGTTDLDVRASHQRKQVKASYAFSNRSYQHRAMVTGSTGMMENGWAVTASLSTRQGKFGFVEGTSYDAYSYFLSVEKKIGKKHYISFTGFGAPAKRGMQSAAVQEVYDLLGDNYYNPNWGWQNGEVRNSRIRTTHEPVITLSHYYDINDKMKLTTTIGTSFGRMGTTALNWYDAADPRPDYYRYLPSYQENRDLDEPADPLVVQALTEAWQNDESYSQINWNRLYQTNYLSYLNGDQAKYILEERRLDHVQGGLSSHLNYEVNNHIFITGGININLYKSHNYKVIADMLDGMSDINTGEAYEGWWVDIDQYSERDFPSDTLILQNDLNNPDRIVRKGDKYGYDYNIHMNKGSLWGVAEFTFNHFDFYAGLNLTGSQYWRTGNMKNGRFADDSYGKSEKHNFFDYAVKAGVTYKPTGRHYILLNGAYMTMAPSFSDVYLSPRVRNTVIPEIKSKKVFSADLSYIVRYPKFNARVTAFHTMFWNDTKVNGFYHDDLRTFVNYMMFDINKVHQGIELGAEIKIIPVLSATLVASYGNYRYTNRPTGYMSVENGSLPDSMQTIYCKNFYVNGTPQAAGSLGLKFNHNYWFANLNANLFANNWVDFSAARRTVEAIQYLYPGDARVTSITEQYKANAKPQFTLDASVSKSFKIKKFYLILNGSVSNILNNTKMITSGYEQLRFDYNTLDTNKFPAKYYYGLGRTFYFMITFRY